MSKILLLGHDRARAGGLRTLLRKDGHHVRWLRNVQEWSETESAALPELVIAAVESARDILYNGHESSRRFPAPLLFVQEESEFIQDIFMEDRLIDRLESPFMQEDLLARVDALVKVRKVILRLGPSNERHEKSSVSRMSGLRGRLGSLFGGRARISSKPAGPYREVAARVADWSDHRDGFEPGHAERVAGFCAMMAEGLGLPGCEVEALLRAAMLHDIGKVAIPVELLRRKGPLGEDQMRLIRTHPQRGAALLRALDRDEEVARIILYHHEKMDGSGYYGRKPERVPLSSRILAVAETYDAMTQSHVRETVDRATAMRILMDDEGRKFDGDCVDALARALTPRRQTIPLSPGYSW